MNIPLVDLKGQYAPLKPDILSGISHVLDGMQLFLGENVRELESEFARYCGALYGIGVSDGTAALQIILRALGIGPEDEVITVSHTFIATAEAIVLAGARPVFVDITPDTCLIDVAQVESRITSRTKAILPVHLYGQAADMEPLTDLAKRHGLRIIEDACQAHGAEYRGRRAGALGDAAAFSFYYSKNLGGYGEGGMIVTSDEDVWRKARMIRDHGSNRRYFHDLIGWNGRLDEIQAVVLRAKLPHLDEWNERRRRHASRYAERLVQAPVSLPTECPDRKHVYHLYVIRSARRDALQQWLKERGVSTGIHYPAPVHLQKAFSILNYRPGDLPITEQVAGEILSLPMFAELTDEQIDYVADAIHAFGHASGSPGHDD